MSVRGNPGRVDGSFADLKADGDAEAQVIAAAMAWEAVAVGAAEQAWQMVPRAAAHDAQLARPIPCRAFRGSAHVAGVPDIGDPFADIAVDVVKTEDIRGIGAGRAASAAADAGANLPVEIIGEERGQVLAKGE